MRQGSSAVGPRVHPGAARAATREPGRSTRHAFSFGRHYDPDNVAFGPLLALNDDRLAPGGGYPAHRHDDLDIVTWVVGGRLRHTGPDGRTALVPAGSAQLFAVAGPGEHAEVNPVADAGVHLVQMWLRPVEPGPAGYRRYRPPAGPGLHLVAAGPDAGRGRALPLRCPGARLWLLRAGPGARWSPAGNPLLLVAGLAGRVDTPAGPVGPGDDLRSADGRPVPLVAGPAGVEALVWQLPEAWRPSW